MRIFARVPWGRGVKRQWSCRQRQFSVSLLDIYSGTSDLKCVTLNELEALNGYFALNSFFFAPVWLSQTVRLSKNNCAKTNKDSNFVPTLPRLRDIAGFLLRRATPPLFHPNFRDVPFGLDCRCCGTKERRP